jgi:hypothetical protein
MKQVLFGCVSLAAAAQLAGAQAPTVSKAGADALMIDLVGRSPAAAAVDTTSILVGRDELRRFVQSAQALRAAQPKACGARGPAAPTLGSEANQWFLRLQCEPGGAAGAVRWGLLYTAGAKGDTTRTATIGSASEVDAWLARVGAMVQGPRPIKLKG